MWPPILKNVISSCGTGVNRSKMQLFTFSWYYSCPQSNTSGVPLTHYMSQCPNLDILNYVRIALQSVKTLRYNRSRRIYSTEACEAIHKNIFDEFQQPNIRLFSSISAEQKHRHTTTYTNLSNMWYPRAFFIFRVLQRPLKYPLY